MMRYTILAENAAGGLVGDDNGKVHEFGAEKMGTIPEADLKNCMPATARHLAEAPDEFPQFALHVSIRYGLKVQAGFDTNDQCWNVMV